MGKINKGILGGFKGKVGTVIGTSWKGRDVMRSRPNSVHDARTEAQLAQRERFALVGQFSSACTAFIRAGFHNSAGNISEVNMAVRTNLRNGAISGTPGSYTLDYSRVELSHGHHVNPTALTAVATTDGSNTINISWTDNSSADQTIGSNDIVMICVYNPTVCASVSSTATYQRRDQGAAISYPATWQGNSVEVFVATRNSDNTDVSPTAYIGSLTLA